MKIRWIACILTMALVAGGCGKTEPTGASENMVQELPSPTIPPPPTATPIPTPIPIPDVMINAPDTWTQMERIDSRWVYNDWMIDALETLEWYTDNGATVITADFEQIAAEKADEIFLMYEDAIKADVYAPHGDCDITMVAYENTVGLLISSKWESRSYGCFVTGNVSSGIGIQALYDALGNFDKFNMYNYDMGKLINHRISIDGEARIIDYSYKDRLEETAAEATGWRKNGDWMESVEEIYRLVSSQRSDFEQGTSAVSETVYTNIDKIRVCDVHLPAGYQKLELYDEGEREENRCGVRLYGKNNMFSIDGITAQEYLDYIDNYVWGDEPDPTPEVAEGDDLEEEESEKPAEDEEDAGEESEEDGRLEIFSHFDIPEGVCYLFTVRSDTADGNSRLDYMAVVLNNINDTSCSMFISASVLDTKKKVIDLAERLFR